MRRARLLTIAVRAASDGLARRVQAGAPSTRPERRPACAAQAADFQATCARRSERPFAAIMLCEGVAVDFSILGPFEAADEAGPLKLTGGKQKALLALLLLNADHVVPMSRIVDDLWGETVPDSAQKMVQIFVSQLRRQLPDGMLQTRAPGYLVVLDEHSLDLRRFERLGEWGRTALAQGGSRRQLSDCTKRWLFGAALRSGSSKSRSPSWSRLGSKNGDWRI
jgi:hypothetical protein